MKKFLTILIILILPVMAFSQDEKPAFIDNFGFVDTVFAEIAKIDEKPAFIDNFGFVDTVFAEIAKINDSNWTVTISISNDEDLVGMSIPFKMTAGFNRIVADSAIYTGGRVDHFAYKGFRADTAIQCVTLGLLANMGPTDNKLTPGQGRLVTVFVSSLENKPIEKLDVDTTTTNPNNSLMIVAGQVTPDGDTISMTDHKIRTIRPHFFVIKE